LRASLITSVSTRYTSVPAVSLLALEIGVRADVWYASQHVSERFTSRTLQSSLQDLAVLLLGTAVSLGSTLFERTNEFIWQVSDHQLRHGAHLQTISASNASTAAQTAASIASTVADLKSGYSAAEPSKAHQSRLPTTIIVVDGDGFISSDPET
jgi:hypothetical protein